MNRGRPVRKSKHWAAATLVSGWLFINLVISPAMAKRAVPAEVQSLIEQLDAESPQTRHLAAKQLQQFGPAAEPAIPPLIEQLDDYERFYRNESDYGMPSNTADDALALIGAPAIAPLKKALHTDDEHPRGEAADVLAEIGPKGRAVLIDAVRSSDVSPREIGHALHRFSTEVGAEVVALVKSDDADVQARAIKTLDAMAYPPAERAFAFVFQNATEKRLIRLAADALTTPTRPGATALAQAVADAEGVRRRAALEALSGMGAYAEKALPILGQTLWSTEEQRLARNIVLTLEEIAAESRDFRKAEDKAVGIRAANMLREARSHQDQTVREHAARALGRLGEPIAAQPLLDKANDEDAPHGERRTALRTLRFLARVEKSSLKVIRGVSPLLSHDNPDFASGAAEVMANARGQAARQAAIEALRPMLEGWRETWNGNGTATQPEQPPDWLVAAVALGRLEQAQARAPLIAGLRFDKWRRTVASSLAKVGGQRAGEALLKTFERGDGHLRPVIRALGRMQHKPAVQPLIDYLDTAADKNANAATQPRDINEAAADAKPGALEDGHAIAGALARIGGPAIDRALAIARDRQESEPLRLLMLYSVKRSEQRSAVPRLIPLLDDPNPRIVDSTCKALTACANQPFDTQFKAWKQWWSQHHDAFKGDDADGSG